jgi:hypothetical protein
MVVAQKWLKIEYYINVDKDDCFIILDFILIYAR